MNITVLRLHELSEKELEALGTLMRGEIQPASITEGSTWVCQRAQRPHFWQDKEIARVAGFEGPDSKFQAWVIFEGKAPVGLCMIVVEPEALLLTNFLVETSRAEKEQFAVADTLALRSLSELPERKEIYGWFPSQGFAARYAKRCGFKSVVPGKPMVVEADPIMCWWTDPAVLKKNIEVLRDHR